TLATSGFHLGVTRVVVEAIGKKQPQRVAPAMRRATLFALLFGVFASLLLLFLAKPIGLFWLKDPRTVPSLRLFGLTLPLISLSSAWGDILRRYVAPIKTPPSRYWSREQKLDLPCFCWQVWLPWTLKEPVACWCWAVSWPKRSLF
ncbi:MAG: hypothetical protein IJX62_07915, partial [Clostridia bacterium]|nr:hypothetical protein [Clostridia bacterium]